MEGCPTVRAAGAKAPRERLLDAQHPPLLATPGIKSAVRGHARREGAAHPRVCWTFPDSIPVLMNSLTAGILSLSSCGRIRSMWWGDSVSVAIDADMGMKTNRQVSMKMTLVRGGRPWGGC